MTIRTGIIGYGLSGRVFHAPFLAANGEFSIDVIATSDEERRAQAAADHPSALLVSTPDDLLSRAGDLDLVVLASPPGVHRQQGVAALEAGAAVVVDKPFAPSLDDVDALIAASESAGRPLIVFQNRRWDGDFLTVRRLLDEGAFGDVVRFESTFERWGAPKVGRWQSQVTVAAGGGILFDLGSHLVDQALQLFGPAETTAAETRMLRLDGASEDDAFISLAHESGVRSHLGVSRVARQSAPRFRVLGTEGAYSVSGLDGQENAIRFGGASPVDPDFGITPPDRWGLFGTEGSADGLRPVETVRGDYAAFYRGVADAVLGRGPSPVDPASARMVVEVISHAHRLAADAIR